MGQQLSTAAPAVAKGWQQPEGALSAKFKSPARHTLVPGDTFNTTLYTHIYPPVRSTRLAAAGRAGSCVTRPPPLPASPHRPTHVQP